MDYVTPAGFRDVLADEACARERIAHDVQACFAARGYLPIETPTLEVMDVMRAGGRMPGSPFKFFDASGDLLAMRPDVTLQVARMCATRLAGQPADFIGFKVPDYFLAGCGMDLGAEARFRRLPYVIALMRNPRRRP